MKILHVTDLHAQRDWYTWLAREASRYDLVCFSGDLLDECSRVPLGEQIGNVRDYLRLISTPLAICRGNHDVGDDARQNGNWMGPLTGNHRWIDERRFSFRGLSFASFGWGQTLPDDISVDVIIAHAPPSGTAPARTRTGQDWGDRSLARLLTVGSPTPRLLLSGHVHEPEKWSATADATWIFNPGVVGNFKIPNHVIIDTHRRVARWIVNGQTRGHENW